MSALTRAVRRIRNQYGFDSLTMAVLCGLSGNHAAEAFDAMEQRGFSPSMIPEFVNNAKKFLDQVEIDDLNAEFSEVAKAIINGDDFHNTNSHEGGSMSYVNVGMDGADKFACRLATLWQ